MRFRCFALLVSLTACSSTNSSGPNAADASADGGATPDSSSDASLVAEAGSAPGTATISVEFVNPSTNAVTTAFTSGEGTVNYDAANNANAFGGDLKTGATARSVTVMLIGQALAAGTTFTMNNLVLGNSVTYFETPSQKGWTSSAVATPSGTVTIDTLVGKTFTFTIHDVAMSAGGATLNANGGGTGTFTLKGTGTATIR